MYGIFVIVLAILEILSGVIATFIHTWLYFEFIRSGRLSCCGKAGVRSHKKVSPT